MSSFTPEQLADRWYDLREIKNLAGKYVTSLLLKREATVFQDLWADRSDVCLTFNNGSYIGKDAVSGYYAAQAEATRIKSEFLKERFPQRLGELSDEAVYGVGQMESLPLTTPVVELAGDGQTAKGIWNVQGSDNGVTAAGAISFWSVGNLCIDFIREGEDWKIWHLFYAVDINCAMGESWVHPKSHEPDPEFAALSAIQTPPYTEEKVFYPAYTADRPFTAPPRPPEPYETFAETFSYGVERSVD